MRVLMVLMALATAGCGGQPQTLRPAAEGRPALRAAIERPEGPGPFPVVVLLHGCAGPWPNAASWSSAVRARGYMAVTPDQFGPRGIAELCTQGDFMMALFHRITDTLDLLQWLQARPDVQPDRIALIGFSMGGALTIALMDAGMAHRWPDAAGRPVAGIAVYPPCTSMPHSFSGPLLILAGGADDWTPAAVCERRVADRADGPNPPELHVIPGAHHGFDDPEARGLVVLRNARNPNSPTGRGATVAYNAWATREAERRALAFLDRVGR